MASVTEQPTTLQSGTSGHRDAQIAQLMQQVRENDLSGFRFFLSRARMNADWQDRIYVLECVAPEISIDTLDAASAAEPDAADLLLIRCAYYGDLAKSIRGSGTANQVAAARFQNSAECVKAAMNDMARSMQLDDKDPTAPTLLLKPLTIFTQTELQAKIFAQATAIAPGLVPAHFALTTALSQRWGGSHKTCLDFARESIAKALPGSDMAACLFWAHTLVRTHFIHFDKDAKAASQYAKNPDILDELNTAFDNWLVPSYIPCRSSIQYLHKASEWYRAVRDVPRLSRVIALTGEELKLPALASAPARKAPSRQTFGGVLSHIFGIR